MFATLLNLYVHGYNLLIHYIVMGMFFFTPGNTAPTTYSQFYTGTLDQRVNACISDAEAGTNGYTSGFCDASAEGGPGVRLNTYATITLGTSSGVGVGLILPCVGVWVGTMTDGTSSVLNQYGATTIKGCQASALAGQFGLTAAGSSNLGYVYRTTTATNPYIYASGFNVVNVSGGHATANGIGAFISGPLNDASTLEFVNVYDSLDNCAAEVYGTSASFSWTHSSLSGGNGFNTLCIVTDNTNYNQSIIFDDDTIVHPGPGYYAIKCTDTKTTHISDIIFQNLYTETGTDGITPVYYDAGCSKMSFTHVIMKNYASSGQALGLQITNAYANAQVIVDDWIFRQGNATYTFPAEVLTNANTGDAIYSDANGNYSDRYVSGLSQLYSAAGKPLPTCNSTLTGRQARVSDATSPTFNATYTSGGAVIAAVMCNGSNWITY